MIAQVFHVNCQFIQPANSFSSLVSGKSIRAAVVIRRDHDSRISIGKFTGKKFPSKKPKHTRATINHS